MTYYECACAHSERSIFSVCFSVCAFFEISVFCVGVCLRVLFMISMSGFVCVCDSVQSLILATAGHFAAPIVEEKICPSRLKWRLFW